MHGEEKGKTRRGQDPNKTGTLQNPESSTGSQRWKGKSPVEIKVDAPVN